MRRLRLRNRLYLVAALALLPALVILLSNDFSVRQARELEVNAIALRTGELASLELERIISGSEGILRAIAHAPVVAGLDPGCGAYLAPLGVELAQFEAIAIIDSKGNLVCRSAAAKVKTGYADHPYFQEAMRTQSFVVGTYRVSINGGGKILPLAMPIQTATGETVGVVAAGLDLGWLGARLREREFATSSALTIADRDGTIIAREPLPERFVGTRIPDDSMPLVKGDRPGTLELTSQDGTRRIEGYFPAATTPYGLYISAGLSKDDAFLAINEAFWRDIVIAALGAAIAFGTAAAIGNSLVRGPVTRLLDTIAAWRAGDESARTGMSASRNELDAVGVAIDGFMDELAGARTERRKAEAHRDLLVGELNHRVKNMLATIQAIAAQTFRPLGRTPELLAFEGRLAALAKAHDSLLDDSWSKGSFADTVRKATSVFDTGLHRFTMAGLDLAITSKAALSLSMAMHELATNAVKYGALSVPEGTVSLRWGVSGDIFHFDWVESGGPAVQSPAKRGFGSSMIERVLAAELQGTVEIDYAPAGLRCELRCPASVLLWKDEPSGR